MKELVNLKNTLINMKNLDKNEMLEIQGGQTEIGQKIYNSIGYVGRVLKMCSSYFATHGKDPIGYYYGK